MADFISRKLGSERPRPPSSWLVAAKLAGWGCPSITSASGWSLIPANVNIIKGLLEAECITKPDSPVVIYAMDNSCFMNMSSDGTISRIKKLEDGKYHVVGDLAITPGILLRPMYAALDEIVKLCGERRIYILTPLPRYILVPCCDYDRHCINLVVKDDISIRVYLTSWTSWT